jgi:hypothetical protein
MRLTGLQIAAAITLADLTREGLAKEAKIGRNTLNNIINETATYRGDTIQKIRSIVEARGIEFTDSQGVRMKSTGINVYEGPERFNEFYDFLYEHIKKNGGDICLSISDERLLSKYRKNPVAHYERMQDLSDKGGFKSFRILANKSNFASKYSYNTYKWQPDASIAPTAFYTFGDCLALISFVHNPAPYVVVLQSAPIAQSYRQAFDIAWSVAKEPPSPAERK